MSELKPCPFCGGQPKIYGGPYSQEAYTISCNTCSCDLTDNDEDSLREQWNTRTQSQWISEELAPALNKCFKSKIGCDGMLMVAVDDYNELVDLINKAAAPKEQGQ
jgi:Lar family restriction alleviation protein